MNDNSSRAKGLSRRAALGTPAKTVVASVVLQPFLQTVIASIASADEPGWTQAPAV